MNIIDRVELNKYPYIRYKRKKYVLHNFNNKIRWFFYYRDLLDFLKENLKDFKIERAIVKDYCNMENINIKVKLVRC